MEFVERRPDHAYIDTHLWLPQMRMQPDHIRSALTFQGTPDELRAWDMTPHHMRVPRNFMARELLTDLPFPLVDARVVNFPKISIKSRVVLDAQDPSKTFQREGSAALLACDDGILCLRCGAGKTVVALHSAAQLGVPFIIFVANGGLAEQWIGEIKEFLEVTDEQIGRIGGAANKRKDWRDPSVWKKPICVAVVHTIAKAALENTLPEGMTRWFGLVIPDEAHVMAAPWFNAAIPPFHGKRWALTATPDREDQYDPLLKYTFGKIVYSYLTPELKPIVLFRRLDTKLNANDPVEGPEVRSVLGDLHHGKIYGFLPRRRPKRTATIVMDIRTAIQMGRQVLVLTHSREMIEALAPHFPDAGIIHADVPSKNRVEIIKQGNPVISVIQLGKEALNKPSLDTLFLLEPTKKAGALQQIFGRILRIRTNKYRPVAIIYEDEHIGLLARMCGAIRTTLNRWPAAKGGRIEHKAVVYGTGHHQAGNLGRGVHPMSASQVQVGLAADLRKRE